MFLNYRNWKKNFLINEIEYFKKILFCLMNIDKNDANKNVNYMKNNTLIIFTKL